jgi:hypothetical protein
MDTNDTRDRTLALKLNKEYVDKDKLLELLEPFVGEPYYFKFYVYLISLAG